MPSKKSKCGWRRENSKLGSGQTGLFLVRILDPSLSEFRKESSILRITFFIFNSSQKQAFRAMKTKKAQHKCVELSFLSDLVRIQGSLDYQAVIAIYAATLTISSEKLSFSPAKTKSFRKFAEPN